MSKEQTPKKWIDFQQEQMEKSIREDCQKAMYTAQEGSTLDKIWKGEFMKEQTPITDKVLDNILFKISICSSNYHKREVLREEINAKVLEALENSMTLEEVKSVCSQIFLAVGDGGDITTNEAIEIVLRNRSKTKV